MAKMHFGAQTNVQGGPSLQAKLQPTHDTMRNQAANNSCQYMTQNNGVWPQQSVHAISWDGAYFNNQTTQLRTSAVPQQTAFSQVATNNVLQGNQSFILVQSGNPPISTGFQATSAQGFHQNSGFTTSSTQSPPNTMRVSTESKTVYTQKSVSAHQNKQNYFNHHSILVNLLQSEDTGSSYLVPANATAANSSKLALATTQNGQSAYYQNQRQHGFSPSNPSQRYAVVSHPFKNVTFKNVTYKSSNQNIVYVSSAGQKTKKRRITSTSKQPKGFPPPYHSIDAMTKDDRRQSSSADSDGSPQLANNRMETVKKFRPTESYQNQPMTMSDLSASQALPLNSITTHSVLSREQHYSTNTNPVPQESFLPYTSYQPNDNRRGTANAFPQNNSVTIGTQLSLTDKGISPQRCNTNSLVSFIPNYLQSSVKANDNSSHTSPGHTGQKAVAIVQPLAQSANMHTSSNQLSEHNAADESLSKPDMFSISPAVAKPKDAPCFTEGPNLHPENSNQTRANTSLISCSAASNDGSCADAALHADSSQNQLCTDGVAQTTEQPGTSEVPASQSGGGDEIDQSVFDLSSIPTHPWTIKSLQKLLLHNIKENEEVKLGEDLGSPCVLKKVIDLFWDGDVKNLIGSIKKYKNRHKFAFCNKYVTPDTVILSQVKSSFKKHLSKYHVLEAGEVYTGEPFKSSWRNTNQQLDDIDKEFGFPWCLKQQLNMPESQSQPDQVCTVNSIPEQIGNEVPNVYLSQSELEPADSGEARQTTTAEATQAASPDETESVDSSDPHYSFEIKVLCQEEAKAIFEQGMMPSIVDTDFQPERVVEESVADKEEKSSEEFCCIRRMVEILNRSDPSLLGKCQCEDVKSLNGCPEKSLDKETEDRSELCNKLSETVCSTATDNKETKMDSSQSIIKTEDQELSSCCIEILSDSDTDCQVKSTASLQACAPASSDTEMEILTSSASSTTSQESDLEENYELAPLTSTDESSPETEEQQMEINVTAALQTTVQEQTKSRHDRFYPIFKKSTECKLSVNVDSSLSTEGETRLPPPRRSVKLVLFGSAQTKRCSIGSRNKHVSFPGSDRGPRPPEVVSVSLSPLKRKSSEPIQMAEESGKETFPLPKSWDGSKREKNPKCIYDSESGLSQKQVKNVAPTNTKKLTVSSGRRGLHDKTEKLYLHLKKRKDQYEVIKRKEKRMIKKMKKKKDMVTLGWPAHQDGNQTEKGSQANLLSKDNVLRFSVLPTTFKFKDGSNERKETDHAVLDGPALVEENDKSPDKPVTPGIGMWASNPAKKYAPLCKPSSPKTSGLFLEFKKKFNEKFKSQC